MAVMARRLACFALSFAAIWAIAACVAALGLRVVLMNPATFERLADDDGFVNAVQGQLDAEVVTISQTTHLPQELLVAALPEGEQLRSILRENLADFPRILGGGTQDYGYSLDAGALHEDMLAYAESTFGAQFAETHAADLELLAQDVARSFEGTLRVIDARSIVAMPAFDGALALAGHAWLFCIGAAVLAALCVGLVCGLSRGEHGIWLFSVGLCAGLVLLVPIVLVEALGLHAIGIEPPVAALLVDQVVRGFELVFAVAAALALAAAVALLARRRTRPHPARARGHGE